MKKRKKLKKLWVVLTLFISLISVQTMQIMEEASTENVDGQKCKLDIGNTYAPEMLSLRGIICKEAKVISFYFR